MARQPFVWGQGGRKMTPEEVDRQRLVAQALLARGSDFSPAGHWTEALGRAFNGWASGRLGNLARQSEEAGMAGARDTITSNPVLAALMGGGGVPGASPAVVSPSGGAFPASLIDSESGGNWGALNSEGYGGRLQFGDARLADAAAAGIIPAGMTGAQFAQLSPEQQMAVENWHFADIDSQAQARGLDRYIGQEVGGVPITQDAIRSMAHLGGIGGASRFLASGGQYNPSDSNGTSLLDYARRHGGASYAAPNQNVVAALMQAQADPWVQKAYGPQIGALLQQQMGMQNAAYEQQLQQQDPMYQAQLAKLLRPEPVDPFAGTQVINGQLVRMGPSGPEVVGDYRDTAADASAPEARIARVTENLMATGDFVDRQEAENIAVGIVDGRLLADRHPTTGQLQVVDMATGRVAYGGPDAQQVPEMPLSTDGGTSLPPAPGGAEAFGLGGAARGLANTLGDVTGLGVPYPETQQAQAEFNVLRESMLNDISEAYGRQPPSWLLQEIRDLTPATGSVTEGPSGASAKLNSLRRNFQSELTFAENMLSQTLSPERRQVAEARVAGLRNALNRVDRGLQMLGSGGDKRGQGRTQSGIEWRIVE